MTDREIILDALLEILEKKQYSHLVMKAVLDKYEYLPKMQRSFIKRVCEGTIEQKIKLDYVIDQFSKTKVAKMKPLIRTLLRMGCYQILFMDAVPDSAVCNESVKLAAKRGFSNLKGFVNGILRSIAREKDCLVFPSRNEDFAYFLSIEYAMPQWIVETWITSFGMEKTETILRGLLAKRPITIRVRENLQDSLKEELVRRIAQSNVSIKKREELPYAYEISGFDRISTLFGYEEGWFTVQDIGSMQVVEMAAVEPGNQILDVCAAPGGKAIHAADKLMGKGGVLARDLSQEKTELMRENIRRLRAENVIAQCYDATRKDEACNEKYDILIADLPCSGLGVIGRKSDIKYRISPEAIEEIASLQKKILSTVYTYIKKGGTLLYSTCTISTPENEGNRDWILQNLPFTLVEEKQYLPGIHNSDGFYMAKFVRM